MRRRTSADSFQVFELQLRQNRFHHMSLLNARQSLVETLIFVSESFMVQSKQLHYGRLKIANVNAVFDYVVGELVRLANNGAVLKTPARKPRNGAVFEGSIQQRGSAA